jgi:hypothetical protein
MESSYLTTFFRKSFNKKNVKILARKSRQKLFQKLSTMFVGWVGIQTLDLLVSGGYSDLMKK